MARQAYLSMPLSFAIVLVAAVILPWGTRGPESIIAAAPDVGPGPSSPAEEPVIGSPSAEPVPSPPDPVAEPMPGPTPAPAPAEGLGSPPVTSTGPRPPPAPDARPTRNRERWRPIAPGPATEPR